MNISLFVLALVILITFFVYRKTRSGISALIAAFLSFFLVPLAIDQIRLLTIEQRDMTNETKPTPSTTTTAARAYNSTASQTCQCS